MSSVHYWALAVAVMALGGAAAGTGLVGAETPGASYVYETEPVTTGQIRRVVATSGTVRPRITVQVGSEISGRIKSIVTDFNASVNAGDLLAVIEPKTFESKARQAKADVLSAQAHVASAEAALRKAQSVLENAQKAFTRQSILDKKGLSAALTVDTAERDLNVARAEIDVATANINDAKALLAQKQAQYDQAVIDLERTQVRAPISGIVLHRAVDVGQTVAASFQAPELFRLAGDLSSIHIEAQVAEADIGTVKANQPVTFDVDAYPKRKFKGRVEQVRLSPAATDSVVTYTVIINAENRDMALYPGMTANVLIETARREDAVRLPTAAVHFKPPKDVRAATNATGATSAVVQHWAEAVELDAPQVARLQAHLAKIKTDKRAKKTVTANIVEDALKETLSAAQRERLASLRKDMAGTKAASVWVLGSGDAPEKRSIQIGLADLSHVELTSNNLKPGDKLIVRSRKASGK